MDLVVKVDDRENSIHDHLKQEFAQPPLFNVNAPVLEIERLDIADFIILARSATETRIMAIIERKTLADYAASIKDGRMINLDKLLALQQESGCQIWYLIEGRQDLRMDAVISGIEYYKILAHMRDTQLLHGVNLLQTVDKFHTAREVKFLAERYFQAYDALCGKLRVAGGLDEIVEKCKPTEKQLLRTELMIIWTNLLSKSEKVQTQIRPSLRASTLARMFSLLKWLKGTLQYDEIDAIKVDGRRLTAWQVEMLSMPMSPALQLKALTCIKGISEKFAKAILARSSIINIITDPQSHKFVILGNRRLGTALRDKIIKLFKAVIRD